MAIAGTDKALMYALSNVMRAGASRAGYHSGDAMISLGGQQIGTFRDDADARVLMESLQINDVLDETPNTCTFTVMGMQPVVGLEIVITLGSIHNTTRLFAGIVLSTDGGYEGRPTYGSVGVHGIDYTYLANAHKVLARYQTQSASAIAIDIMNRFTQGFTTHHVEADLTTISEITFTNQDVSSALTALARRVGAYWYIDYYRDLHFFTEEVTTEIPDPQPITEAHRSLMEARATTDLSQMLSAVFFEGGGSSALARCEPGATSIPVAAAVLYPLDGGTVVSGPQRLTYTSKQSGGTGALVGPTATPSVAPAPVYVVGSGLPAGRFWYAYTWITSGGIETLASPNSITMQMPTTGAFAAPVYIQTWNASAQNHTSSPFQGWQAGDVVEWSYSYGVPDDPAHASAAGPVSYLTSVADPYSGRPYAMVVRVQYAYGSTEPRVGTVYIWARINGGPVWMLAIANRPYSGSIDYEVSDLYLKAVSNAGASGGFYPPVPAIYNAVQLKGIALGGTDVVSRKVYRTTAAGSQLKLLTTIADNTTTTITDTAADATLGANVPTTSASSGGSGTGQVPAGAAVIPVSGTGPFVAAGGWVIIGQGVPVRYTGVSGTSLTGVPAAGVGALASSINYGAAITAAPALIGVPASGAGAIVVPINSGDNVNVLARADDLSLQASLATLLGGDGVWQTYLSDGRLSYDEALARAQAHLALKSHALVSVTYTCRDVNTRSGRSVTIELSTPEVSGIFKLQQVAIGGFGPHTLPTYSVTASTERFTFEDLIRLIKGTEVA